MFEDRVFSISSGTQFEELAIELFHYQYENVPVYRDFCDHLRVNPASVTTLEAIPFLPIEFFKSFSVISSEKTAAVQFASSGTTGSQRSYHHVASTELYQESFRAGFQRAYGNVRDYVILALLPSYQEQGASSLIYMVDQLIKDTGNLRSGFYLDNLDALGIQLEALDKLDKKVLLIGVSYALLDLLEANSFQLNNTYIIETGGMKGRRKELIKEALHDQLKTGFGVDSIHSEYGMTELLSQAYSHGNGLFQCPPWMRVLTRDPEDPLTLVQGKTGGINVIDLANMYSCSFIATQDLGKLHRDGNFEILGRFDTSDIRGCNLMIL